MPSFLAGFETWLPGIGITGVLVFLITGFAKSWILTRGQVEWIMEGLKTASTESREREKEWKAAYDAVLEANKVYASHFEKLMTTADTTNRLLTALTESVERRDQR